MSSICSAAPEPSKASSNRRSVHPTGGERIAVLHDGWLPAGRQEIAWDGQDSAGVEVASGVYLVETQGNGDRITAKVAVLR